MKVSIDWLREFIDFAMSAEDLADRLEMTGTAIEGMQKYTPSFRRVLVGLVKQVSKHPKADRLSVCKVDIGIEKPLSIVCGAPNVAQGQKVPVAMVGGGLPGGAKISRVLIRGIESEGMIASESELGLGEDTTGIMVLDVDAVVGCDLAEVLGLTDTVIDFEITPNRPDCMSMIGIAREVAVLTGNEIRLPDASIKEESDDTYTQARVMIDDTTLCPRYTARVITDVEVCQSPIWMKQRLTKAGIRPINNLVDITNYVLIETGQPLHSFDKDRIKDSAIIVRRAVDGEKMTTLDGEERILDSDILVIADPSHVLALAGVMGGEDSEINDATSTCLLESAYFSPTGICRTAYKLDMRTEASSRFERGTDPNITLYAANRASKLMQDIAAGHVLRGAIDKYSKPIKPKVIKLRKGRASQILGIDLKKKEVVSILEKLELEVNGDDVLKVTIPTFRPDLEREIDLVEEVARIYGFENIPSTLPRTGGCHGGLKPEQKTMMKLRDTLIACGLQEIITYAFMGIDDIEKMGIGEREDMRSLCLENPISEDQCVLRTTMLSGLLKTISYNKNYGLTDIHVFEVGRVFHDRGGLLPNEKVVVTGAITGAWESDQWYKKARNVDFFDVKGILEAVLNMLRVTDYSVVPAVTWWSHPGKSAIIKIEDNIIGSIGEVHPVISKAFDIEDEVFVFDLDADRLTSLAMSVSKANIPSRFPSIIYDLALMVDVKTSVDEIESAIISTGGSLLKDAKLFDLYEGEQLPSNKKSLAFHLIFQAADRTLKDNEADKIKNSIIRTLENDHGAKVRV